ncbi:MAG: hypothetical protein OEY24_01820 [Candidatus Bathyarchaeota archaeon]|nr:hypothetical protein [Candidatus Bathyarchaeota archaeon]MDH5494427.1 hypothetical protein [Candidatus Bathyarchaeota archaeon]
MCSSKLVASLDVVIHMLADPCWSKKAKEVKTLREMQQFLLDFCKANGKVTRIDKDTVHVYL